MTGLNGRMRQVSRLIDRIVATWRPRSPAAVPRPLLTPREVAFWHLLRGAAAPLHVAPQVAMGALLGAAGGSRARFDRRIVDFVVLADDGAVRLLVEVDDRLHDRRRDAARDRDTAAAGYRTLRVEGVTARDPRLLTDVVDAALGRPRRWSPPIGAARREPSARPPSARGSRRSA